MPFVEFANVNTVLGTSGLNFEDSNLQNYNGYIYGCYPSINSDSFVYRFNLTDSTDFTKQINSSLAILLISVDSTNVYSLGFISGNLALYRSDIALTTSNQITLTGVGVTGSPSSSLHVTSDDDNLYVSDGSAIIYKIVKNTGVVSILATHNHTINNIQLNTNGDLYFIDNTYSIHSVTPSGTISATLYTFSPSPSNIATSLALYNGIIYINYKNTASWYILEYSIANNTFTPVAYPQFTNQNPLSGITFTDDGNNYVILAGGNPTIYVENTICFNQGTKILCMNQQLEDEYVAIELLKVGDFVKTFKHGYRKVSKTITGSFRNNPKKWNMCMYKMTKNESNGLLEDLIVTGGHSLLVDSLSDAELSKYSEMGIPDFANQTIDNKHLVLSCVSDDFVPMPDTERYHYYHLLLENNDDEEERFGIWANGVLTETPNEKTVK